MVLNVKLNLDSKYFIDFNLLSTAFSSNATT